MDVFNQLLVGGRQRWVVGAGEVRGSRLQSVWRPRGAGWSKGHGSRVFGGPGALGGRRVTGQWSRMLKGSRGQGQMVTHVCRSIAVHWAGRAL
jgi:hypothetical protein